MFFPQMLPQNHVLSPLPKGTHVVDGTLNGGPGTSPNPFNPDLPVQYACGPDQVLGIPVPMVCQPLPVGSQVVQLGDQTYLSQNLGAAVGGPPKPELQDFPLFMNKK